MFPQQWQVAVGGAAGEQVEHPLLLQGAKASDQIAVAVVPAEQVPLKATLKVQRSGFAIAGGLLQQLQARLNPVWEAFVECAICEQRQEGWGDPHRESCVLFWIACSRLQHLYQGEIALD